MVKLKFRQESSRTGFTSLEASTFNEVPPARIVRELLQNSQDAAVQANKTTAIVRFRIAPISAQEIPDLQGYRKAFQRAVKYWTEPSSGRLSDAAQEVVDRIKEGLQSLENGSALLLSVLDNGVGLDAKRMNSLMSDGASEKPLGLSGSYGIGHKAPMALSNIRYLLYGGQTQDGSRIACGRTLLASHVRRKSLMTAEGYLIKDFKDGLDGNLYEFMSPSAYPRLITNSIDEINMEWGHGCAVLIPVFNYFATNDMRLWDIVSKVAAYNFCPAIQQGKLVIEVCEEDDKRKLDTTSLASILEEDKDRTRAARSDSFFAGLRPSGQNAYSVLQAIRRDRELVKVKLGTAYISLLQQPPNDHHRVDLFRNGMWITDDIPCLKRADFANCQPFHAVIEIEGKNNSELHRLVRKAEGPMHDRLLLMLLSKQDRSTLSSALKEIAEWIRKRIPHNETEEYPVEDFLMVKADTGGAGKGASFSFWGTPTPVSQRHKMQTVENSNATETNGGGGQGGGSGKGGGGGQGGGSGKGGGGRDKPSKQRATRQPFRSVPVHNGNGRLSIAFTSETAFSEALITLHVDENADFTCDRIWADENVSINTFSIKTVGGNDIPLEHQIADDKRSVKVTDLAANTDYEIQVEYDAPQELLSTVGIPVLKLELHHLAKPKS